MNLSTIRNLSETRIGGMKKLATDIGMSEANLHRCVNNNKIQAGDLEKIAKLLKADISTFFDELDTTPTHATATATGDSSIAAINSRVQIEKDPELLQERIKHLEEMLAEKERLITVLMKR